MKRMLYTGLLVLLLAACGRDSAPQAPTGLTAAPGEGKIILKWQDKSSNETGFSVYRQEVSATSGQVAPQQVELEKIGTTPANTEQYEDTSIVPDTLYRYGVTADGKNRVSKLVTTTDDKPVATENRAPSADDQSVTTDEDEPVSVTLSGTDPDGSTLTYKVETQPAHGTLTGNAPKLTYTPDKNYSGGDSFTFSVSDGKKTSALATVTLNIGDVNDVPLANDQEVSTPEDTSKEITLTGSDAENQTLTFAIAAQPSKGTLESFDAAAGTLTYVPDANENGEDTFTFTVSDGAATSAPATVTVNVGVVNDAPVAKTQQLETDEDTELTITLAAGDDDGDDLTYEIVEGPTHGVLRYASASGCPLSVQTTANVACVKAEADPSLPELPNLVFEPNLNYSGDDSFTFKANDGSDDSEVATVSITVKPVNDAPTAITLKNSSVEENQDAGALVGSLSSEDVDSNSFNYSLVEGAGDTDNGSFRVDGSDLETAASFDYETQKSYSVRVEVNDGAGGTFQESFTITVADVDDTQPTVTFDDPGTLTTSKAVTLTGTADDNVGVTSVTLYEGETELGNAALSGNAWSYSYTPSTAGSYTLKAVASDAAGNLADKSVTVSVKSAGRFVDSEQSLGSERSYDVALGDFNGDTYLDAFVANYEGQPNKVYFGSSDGTFSDSEQSLGSESSLGVALGDLNGDGNLDAFVANDGQPNKVYFGSSTGTFSDSGQNLGSSFSYDVALGDFNGDTYLDAFVTNYKGPNRVYFGSSDGTFSDSGQSLGDVNSFGVALGDVNGDGNLDAFVANDGGANKVYFGSSDGIFSDSGQSLGNVSSFGVALGDLNGDGNLDAFVTNYGGANKVYLGSSTGTFSDSEQSLGNVNSWRVALGDVDGDGNLDAFVANDGQPNKVYFGSSDGTFSDSGQSLGNVNSFGVALGDVNGDGNLDAFVANDGANKVYFNTLAE